MRSKFFTAILSMALLLAGCATVPGPSTSQIYDADAEGVQQIAVAVAQAVRERKHVLLNLGANWCSDSHAMFRLFNENPEIRRTIADHYVFEMIDVNQRGLAARNATVVERFSNPISAGIPVLLILDANGTLLNRDPAERLADSAHHHSALVLAYLQKWAVPRPAE